MRAGDRNAAFRSRGWIRFDDDPALQNWVQVARTAGKNAVSDPQLAQWHVCQGTWFVGVDALPNDEHGRVGAEPLRGDAVDFITDRFGPLPPLHKAQVSVTYPGYPKPRDGESEAGFRYRLNRDAAHVDGVRAQVPDRRRQIEECHAFVLGIPLTRSDPDAAPLVVWEHSHHILRAAFADALADHDPATWAQVDVTDAYVAARRTVFETCKRVIVHAQPGQAVVLDRLLLHGVAPWADGAGADPEGRMIAYFRPVLAGGVAAWLDV